MGANRLPYFPFNAGDWITDEAVAGMSAEAEGCYIRLLARSWLSQTPGVVPVGLVVELGGLYRVNGRSTDVQRELSLAFDTESRPGYWVQSRMVLEWERALAASGNARKAGLASVAARNQHPSNGRSTTVEQSFNQVEVEVDLEESKSTHLSPNGDVKKSKRARGVKKPDNPIDREWLETFDLVWWPEYHALGRDCSKAAAREVWAKIPHDDGQADFDQLSAAFDRAKVEWRSRGDIKYTPHAETWLRDYLKNLSLEG